MDHARLLPTLSEQQLIYAAVQKHKRLDVEGKQEEAKQRTLARELDWIRASPKARQAKSKARIKAYDELLAEADSDNNGSISLEEFKALPFWRM